MKRQFKFVVSRFEAYSISWTPWTHGGIFLFKRNSFGGNEVVLFIGDTIGL